MSKKSLYEYYNSAQQNEKLEEELELIELAMNRVEENYTDVSLDNLDDAMEEASNKFSRMREALAIANRHRPGKYKQLYIKRIMSNISKLRALIMKIEKMLAEQLEGEQE